jgi:hypothetical protein
MKALSYVNFVSFLRDAEVRNNMRGNILSGVSESISIKYSTYFGLNVDNSEEKMPSKVEMMKFSVNKHTREIIRL